MLVGMIDYGTCGIEKIVPCENSLLDGIRVIFKKHLKKEALLFCDKLKKKGYKVFAQLVSITSYDDSELMDLIAIANEVKPYAVSIVDTYGLMHQENLVHYFNLLDIHLDRDISIGYHSHNNFQMAYANCIEFLAQNTDRDMILDSTIYGMGKSAGNAPTELLTMHLNNHYNKSYDTSQILEAIDSSVMEFYREKPWGYNMFYYISASNDCHPNYVSYLMNKRTLSVKSISRILDMIEPDKKLMYDEQYIEDCYIDYQKNEINDDTVYENLKKELSGSKVLLLGPGKSIIENASEVYKLISEGVYKVIAINYIPGQHGNINTMISEDNMDYLFLTNSKRQLMLSTALANSNKRYKIIASSNVMSMKQDFSYVFNYSTLLDYNTFIVDNPLLMLLKILERVNVKEIYLAGFDGYEGGGARNYIEQNMEYIFTHSQADELNSYVRDYIMKFNNTVDVKFLTKSRYES